MATARTIITKAMKKAGILFKSETPDDDEVDDALDELNDILEEWSTDSMLAYARSWETFTLTGGDGEYTIGTGGDFNTSKPVTVVSAYIRQDTTDHTLDIVSDEVYNTFIPQKSTQGLPYFLNFDNNYALSKIRLYPVPSTTYSLFLLTEKPLTSLAVDDTVTFPVGWNRALIYNLAVALASEYGQEVSPRVDAIARSSKASIRRAILKARDMDANPLGSSSGNIFVGYNNV